MHEHEAEHELGTESIHPWAREMYRNGGTFRGSERSRLFLGSGSGTFQNLSDLSGADSPLDGRSLLAADFDDDGDLDLFVHNLQRERHNLFRNELGASGSKSGAVPGFVKVRLRATTSQYEAIGATVIVAGPRGPVAQVLSRGAGYASCQVPELVLGLGSAKQAGLSVRWPGGNVESFGRVDAGARVLLVEGAGKPEPRAARSFRLHDPLPEGLKLGLGDLVPDMVLVDRAGAKQTVQWSERVGDERLFLNFWASYCAPCVRELPALQALHESEGQQVFAISVDVPADQARARAVLERAGTRFPAFYLALDDEDNQGFDQLVDLLRLPIPTTLVIGPGGRIEEVLRGPVDAE